MVREGLCVGLCGEGGGLCIMLAEEVVLVRGCFPD